MMKQMDKYNALCKLNDLQWDIKRQPTFEETNKTIEETIIRDERLLEYCAYIQVMNYIVDKKFAEVAKKNKGQCRMNNDYGLCDVCQTPLQADIFIDKEFYPNSNTLTGRTRFAVNFLYCPYCGEKYLVDDTFDGEWHD